MIVRRVATVFAVFALVAACSGDRRDAAVSAPGTTRRGDTIVVESAGDGVWGPAHDAVEVLRVSGATKETSFGQIRAVTATPDGGVIVFDAKGAEGKIIRQFDSTGKFIRNIGREGEGPGEYSTANVKIVVSPRGEILVRDQMRALIRFAHDGRFIDGFSLRSGGGWFGLTAADDGTIYMPAVYPYGVAAPRGDRPPYVKYDATGRAIDTIAPGPAWLAGSDTRTTSAPRYHSASEQWLVLTDGRAVIGRTDKVGFLLIDPGDKRASPLLAEHAHTPVPFLAEERKELQDNNAAEQKGHQFGGERLPGAPPVTVPAHKQAFTVMEADAAGAYGCVCAREVNESPRCVLAT